MLVKFDEEESMNTRPVKKRRVEQPTNENNISLSNRHRERSKTSGKVVTFGDTDQNDHKSAHGTISHSDINTNGTSIPKSRLKQRSIDLLTVRQKLPIWPHADEIRNKIAENDVLLLVGETGSGKSTQIPQFILQDLKRTTVKNGVNIGGTVAITQPRRVAAISLARRVAEEVGTPLGNSSPASLVGYSVRFDSSVSPSTKVKFLTDGMLLQELLRDPWLREYSVVVVDEVHERGVNVDLVLGFLRRLIEGRSEDDGRGGVPLKVVVMSATADMERIQRFFAPGDVEAEGGDGGVAEDAKENGDESHLVDDKKKKNTLSNGVSSKVASCYIKGRQYPVQMHYIPQPVPNALDAALERIIHIHTHTPLPGDILVFLPGQENIDSLESMCISYAVTLQAQSKQKGAPKLPKLLILPLFAALPTAAQQRVFEATPPFTRKIILSTNIAETSVTVPGIRHVIDTGKRKARFFRPSLNLDTLLSKSISRSSANQRAGRAGREAPGNCYRLYTERTYYELTADTEPEILRCDLSQLVLTLKAHNVDNILEFPLLTTPPLKSLERALFHLLRLKSLNRQDGHITTLGRQMSSLPLPANLARILLTSKLPQFNCSEEIIDIVSALSVENIWLPIHNTSVAKLANPITESISTSKNTTRDVEDDDDDQSTNPIAQARSTLYRREGDHLTLLAAMQAYTNENTDRKEWCRRHGISHRAMIAAMDVRKQLTKIFASGSYKHGNETKSKSKAKQKGKKDLSLDNDDDDKQTKETSGKAISTSSATQYLSLSSSSSTSPTSLPTRILQTLLLGLSENTARLSPTSTSSSSKPTSRPKSTSDQSQIWTGPYTHTSTSKSLQIHPSSVLFNRNSTTRPAMIMFSEFVVTGRAYARCVSEIEGGWVDEVIYGDTDGGGDGSREGG